MIAVVFFITHKKGFTFYAQPQTGACSCFYNFRANFSVTSNLTGYIYSYDTNNVSILIMD